jgi:Cellulase (glycosyl hydrolase family 5)
MPHLRVAGHRLRDGLGREVILHGVNLSGDSKLPSRPDLPSHVADGFFDGDGVSFAERPFPLSEAPVHFARLRRWGYNTLRYIFTWEAIEHEGPGRYDDEFVQHTVETLRVAKEFGFRVFMDPHQDVVCGRLILEQLG